MIAAQAWRGKGGSALWVGLFGVDCTYMKGHSSVKSC